MPIKLQHIQLGVFLGASLLLHAVLLLQYHNSDIRLAAQPEQLAGEMLRVSLRQDDSTAPAPPRVTPAHKPAALPTPRTQTTLTPVADAQPTVPATQPNAHLAPHADSETGPANSSEPRAEVLSRVREDFAQHFYYPMLARRHGWQGQVLLGFSVSANGHIHDVHIRRVSGHSILDESARIALNRVRQLQQAQHWLHGATMQLQLSVVYRLQGG